jgi:dienelactone hydrolase
MGTNVFFLLIGLIGLIAGPLGAAGAISERAVNFQGAGGTVLAGTLQLPSGDGRAPALVLLAGSGPTDRDGNQPPALITDLLKQIAQKLADRGIATLRFDKRGMYANASELPKDQAKFGDFFTWENFVGDAVSAVKFLRQQPEVDPNRVGILGHSEGGLLALEAARALKGEHHPPAILILISAPGRPIDAVITDQLKRLLALQGATPQQTEYFLSENARITRAILQSGDVPPDVPAGLSSLYPPYLGKFLQSEMELVPCKTIADFSGPVLIMAGSADTQVSPDRDAKALDAALAARKDGIHTLSIIPNASHNLKVLKNPSDPAFEGPVASTAIDQLQQWLLTNLSRH